MGNTLSEVTDLLNDALIEVEIALAALQLGVSARVPINSRASLAFEKEGGTWQLVIYSSSGSRGPLLKASRGLRVLATKHLDALLAALLHEVDGELASVREALKTTNAFVARLHSNADERAP